MGIENLKKLVAFACAFTKEIANALADGKFQVTEVFGFFDEIMQIPGIVKSFPEIGKEIKDLTAEERQELYLYIQEKFDLSNDATEAAIENSLNFALSAVSLVEQWKALKNT